MRLAYVDASCLVAIAFGEAGVARAASAVGQRQRSVGPRQREGEDAAHSDRALRHPVASHVSPLSTRS